MTVASTNKKQASETSVATLMEAKALSLLGSHLVDESCSFTSDESSDYGGGCCPHGASIPRHGSMRTLQKHCWSEPSAEAFQVRGRSYFDDKKKLSSGPSLFPPRGCDLLVTAISADTEHVGRNPAILGGELRKVPSFLINFRFPWGVLTFTYEIGEKYLPFLRCKYGNFPREKLSSLSTMSPAERKVCRFFMSSDAQKNQTLKLIPNVIEGPWIVRNLVSGTPVIIGKKVSTSYHYEPVNEKRGYADYLEVDLDIDHSIKPRARKIVSVCRKYMESLTFDLGWVLQGEAIDELPEQVLGATRCHMLNPKNAPALPSL